MTVSVRARFKLSVGMICFICQSVIDHTPRVARQSEKMQRESLIIEISLFKSSMLICRLYLAPRQRPWRSLAGEEKADTDRFVIS